MNNENTVSAPNFAAMEQKNVLTFNKIIKWCLYIFIFLLPLWFLPFTGNIIDLNKQVLMIVLLTIALIAWLGKLLTQEKVRWHKELIILIFLGFVIICGLATIFSARPYDSFMGFDTHLNRALINVVYFFVLFLLLINYGVENREKRNTDILKFLSVFLVSSAIVGIIGLLQILGKFIFPWDFAKVNSFNTIGSVNSLGIFLAVILPLTLGLLFSIKHEGKKKEKAMAVGLKILLIVLTCLSLIIILLLNFQTIWIITAVGMVITSGFLLAKRHLLQSQNLAWSAVPVAILALCLIFLFFRPSLFDLQLPMELGLTHRASFDIAKEVIQRNPILGTGPETFVYNYSLYKPEAINQTVFWNIRFSGASSEILSLLSEIGILGVLAFFALIVIFLLKMIKSLIRSEESLGRLAEVKVGLFSGWLALAVSWFLYPQNITLIFVFWLFLAFLIIMISEQKDIKTINLKGSNRIALATSFGFIIFMMIIVGLLYLEGSKFIAEAQYKTGLDLIDKGELNSGINKVIRATVTNPYEDKFYRNLSQLFLVQINQDLNDPGLDPQVQANRVQVGISNAINSASRTTTLNPKDVTNWIVRGSIYRSLVGLVDGGGTWAVKSYEEALKLEPANPFIYTETARAYVAEADLLLSREEKATDQISEYLNKALDAYNEAIKIKSDYSPAHFEIALVYDRQGKINEAISKMEGSLNLAPRDTGILFQLGVLYYKNSQFDKAKSVFTGAVNLDPNFSNARYFLGLLFDREGDKDKAIEQFINIARLNPDNEEIKRILDNLQAGKPALGSAELGPPEQPAEIPIQEEPEE